ncbi:cytochrome P450 [Pseudonocardia ailaonensis]|uniref:Cytochrome P450 n=1 Tax=Pseudonocardia ailaonensis TaxID=367279 RepID=A0ABN2N9L5_9PSEU
MTGSVADRALPEEVGRFLSLDPGVMSCPVDAFDELRDIAPVVEYPSHRMVVVTGRAEVSQVLRDTATFSSNQHANEESSHNMTEVLRRASAIARQRGGHTDLLDASGQTYPPVPPHSDPPLHTRQRRLIQPAFAPRRARAAEDMIVEMADRILDGLGDRDQIEIRSEYSDPLMVGYILTELHSVPEHAEMLLGWVGAFIRMQGSKLTDDELDEIAQARVDFDEYFLERIADIQANGSDDLLGKLVAAEIEGERLTVAELLMVAQTLLVGGTETSSTTTSKAVLHLTQHPELADELRAEPSKLAGFVEETLRLNGPIHLLFRRATRDVDLGGVMIPAGTRVGVHLGAAGRDAESCPVPHEVDVNRTQPPQLMFGSGAHYCAGAELARVQVRVALDRLLRRYRLLELPVPFEDIRFHPQINLHRPVELPIRLVRD